jgi:hypothetical protein
MTQHEFQVGDYARSLESGWVGKILVFETDGNGDRMARMIGVDNLAQLFGGLTMEESLTTDDIQWFAPADLIPIEEVQR